MYIADLHIHSRYSRATSKDCMPEYLDLWARKKGIHIIGTGDFTHPAWREELKEKLCPAEDGLYVLKKEYRIHDPAATEAFIPRFVVTGEISSIYKKMDKVRKVHSLILLPSLDAASDLSAKLEAIGNIHSDGRPILGLDCRDLLEITLEKCSRAIYVPAHIWTPHFSMFGAFSGFDTVEDCFEDMASFVHAIETGLSSDPPMNWRVSALDRFQLISNSDAHSPAKLGREANFLDIDLAYDGLYGAIQRGEGLYGTIEFFPEEGKYHFDGHRKCHVCLSPAQTEKYGGKCPVCGRRLTIGVSHRVEALADRPEGTVSPNARPFERQVPLPEVVGAATGHASTSAGVTKQYEEMLRTLGPEFEILRSVPCEDIRKHFGNLIASGIKRLRDGQATWLPGFDGEYGTLRLFTKEERENVDGQLSLFDAMPTMAFGDNFKLESGEEKKSGDEPKRDGGERCGDALIDRAFQENSVGEAGVPLPNELQREAAQTPGRCVAVVAGPGTGKTKTLIARIEYLLETRRVKPEHITAVTFTNKAAGELRQRLSQNPDNKRALRRLHAGTFHALSMELLKRWGCAYTLADNYMTMDLAGEIVKEYHLKMSAGQFLQKVSYIKSGQPLAGADESLLPAEKAYTERLRQQNALDFDDLLLKALELGKKQEHVLWFDYLLVDEFQDISSVQYELLRLWNEGGVELFVIGDSDQAIYGFRGSDDRCFSRLYEDFPRTKEIRLVENYRSTPQILNSALSVINHNPGSERVLKAHRPSGPSVDVVRTRSEKSQAIFVAHEVNRYIGGIDMIDASERIQDAKTRSFSDIAVLYRTHRQARLLEECLQNEGIPYIVAGRDDFLAEKEVRGSLAFFDWILDPANDVAAKTCLKLMWDYEDQPLTRQILEKYGEAFGPLIKGRPGKLIEAWISDMGMDGNEAMGRLLQTSLCYKNAQEFMEAIHTGIESDLMRCGGKKYTADAVTLMTLHGAKGLEFPVVILYGAQEGALPYESERHPSSEEEERRLFFVGITRAREELVITFSGEPSKFISELPEDIKIRDAQTARKLSGGRQLSLFDLM